MDTITAILAPHADGTLHLPVPPELRNGLFRVTATVEPKHANSRVKFGVWKEMGLEGFWMAPDFDEPLDEFREYTE
jgi:hypothetical protein